MTKTKQLITIFSILFGIVFFAMILSFVPGDDIRFTNLEIENQDGDLSVEKNDPTYGSDDPEILIYHFGNFASPSSAEMSESLKNIADESNNITIIWKDFPNVSLDSESMDASVAARCAQKQDAFWEFHDYLFVYYNQLSEQLYKDIASELDLWQWSFDRCLSKEKTLDWVQESYNEGTDLSITAAPTIFINGERYTGYLKESEIQSIITSLLIELQ